MAAAVDPTYPLYPIASISATAMLLLVFLTNFIRQSWNLGVAFLCFWLFFENLTNGINAIIWADNADVKLYVYCDIVSHLQLITSIVKPMATLIITRRLYLIARQNPLDLWDRTARRWEMAIEWTLGLVIPIIVAGPFYYVVQGSRFEILEGFGCANSPDNSMLSLLLIWSWYVVPPLVSVTVYYPRVARLLYHRTQQSNRFLQSNTSVSRTDYLRVLIFSSLDILITLPIGLASVILTVKFSISKESWAFYSDEEALGVSFLAANYYGQWSSPVLAFAMFGLFGVTSEAQASYLRVIYAIGRRLGWKLDSRSPELRSRTGDIESGEPLDTVLDPEPKSRFSHANGNALETQRSAGGEGTISTAEQECNSNVGAIKDTT